MNTYGSYNRDHLPDFSDYAALDDEPFSALVHGFEPREDQEDIFDSSSAFSPSHWPSSVGDDEFKPLISVSPAFSTPAFRVI